MDPPMDVFCHDFAAKIAESIKLEVEKQVRSVIAEIRHEVCQHLRDVCGIEQLLHRVQALEQKLSVVGKTLVCTDETLPENAAATTATQVQARLLAPAVATAPPPRTACGTGKYLETPVKAPPPRGASATGVHLGPAVKAPPPLIDRPPLFATSAANLPVKAPPPCVNVRRTDFGVPAPGECVGPLA